MKCCLYEDGHIAVEPILSKCGANACKKCIFEFEHAMIHCYACGEKHKKNYLLNSPKNSLAEALIESSLDDLFEYLDEIIESNSKILNGYF